MTASTAANVSGSTISLIAPSAVTTMDIATTNPTKLHAHTPSLGTQRMKVGDSLRVVMRSSWSKLGWSSTVHRFLAGPGGQFRRLRLTLPVVRRPGHPRHRVNQPASDAGSLGLRGPPWLRRGSVGEVGSRSGEEGQDHRHASSRNGDPSGCWQRQPPSRSIAMPASCSRSTSCTPLRLVMLASSRPSSKRTSRTAGHLWWLVPRCPHSASTADPANCLPISRVRFGTTWGLSRPQRLFTHCAAQRTLRDGRCRQQPQPN